MSPVLIAAGLLAVVPVAAQNLEASWTDYLSANAALETAQTNQHQWNVRQQELIAEIRTLQGNQSWYNGWIIEWQIARRSRSQVQLADSLQQVQRRLTVLKKRHAVAFSALKQTYRQLLLAPSNRDELSPAEKEQAIAIGRQFIGRRDPTSDLPDYASMLNDPFEDPAVRRLVLQDLQTVLQVKLGLIDSLIIERETELALLERLDEFHRDLGYQLQSELDPEADADLAYLEATADQANLGEAFSPEERDFALSAFDQEPEYSEKSYAVTSPGQSPLVTGETDVGSATAALASGATPIEAALRQLRNKRQQYQDLMHRINSEQ